MPRHEMRRVIALTTPSTGDALGTHTMAYACKYPRTILRVAGCTALAVLASFAVSSAVYAQVVATPPPAVEETTQAGEVEEVTKPSASRLQLESLAAQLERDAATQDAETAANTRARASAIRERLQNGDFRPGDRIHVVIQGPVAANDTLIVNEGDSLSIPGVADASLRGVLRAEAPAVIRSAVDRMVKNVTVRVQPLMRIAVLGAVVSPGFHDVPSEVALAEVIMRAGGPAGKNDLTHTTVRRGDVELYDNEAVSAALQQGRTLDQMDLRSGDQVVVGEKRSFNALSMLQTAAAVISIGLAAYGISRR